LEGRTDSVTFVALGDGRAVSGAYDNTLRILNIATGECERTLEGHTSSVLSLVALGDGRVVSGSHDNMLRVWNAATGECERTLEGHPYGYVTALVALRDGRVVSAGSHDYMLRVLNTVTGECERTLVGHTWKVSSLVALGDGRVVSGSGDKTLRVWNIVAGEHDRLPMERHTWHVDLLVALDDGRVMSGSKDNTLRLWNASTGECCLSISKSSAEAMSLLALPRMQLPHAALVNSELSAAGSCLVGPGFARTYVDAVVKCVCVLPPTTPAGAGQQAGAVVVVGTANGTVHFFTVVR
jgi:WD40 repeat protein